MNSRFANVVQAESEDAPNVIRPSFGNRDVANTAPAEPNVSFTAAQTLGPVTSEAYVEVLVNEAADTLKSEAYVHGVTMPNPTREEIDAKLEAVEARTETRLAQMDGKIDRVLDAVGNLTTAVATNRTESKEDARLTRWSIVGLAVGALALALASQANLLSAFQTNIALHTAQHDAGVDQSKK